MTGHPSSRPRPLPTSSRSLTVTLCLALLLAPPIRSSIAAAPAGTPGSPDPGFRVPPSAGRGDSALALIVDTQGRCVFTTATGVKRLLPDGSVDTSFHPPTFPDATIWPAAPGPDGVIYVGMSYAVDTGPVRSRVVRLRPDGSVDPAFQAESPLIPAAVNSLAVLAGGAVVVGGWDATTWGGTPSLPRVEVLDAEGRRDESVHAGFMARFSDLNDRVLSVQARPGGGLLARLFGLAVTGRPGTAETGVLTYVDAWVDLPDGGAVTVQNVYRGADLVGVRLRRMDLSGASGPAGEILFPCDGPVESLAVLPDGRFLVAGGFSEIGAQRHAGVARLNTDLSNDTGFVSRLAAGSQPPIVRRMVLGTDGLPLVAGSFTSFGGIGVPGFARLLTGDLPGGPPSIDSGPGSVEITEGVSIHLGFQVASQAPIRSGWWRGGVAVAGATSAVLELRDVRVSAGGDYRLRVTNAVGSAESESIRLTVRPAPTRAGSLDLTFRAALVEPSASVPLTVGQGSWSLGVLGVVPAGDRLYVRGLGLAGADGIVHADASSKLARLHSDGGVDGEFVALRGPNNAGGAGLSSVRAVLPLRDGGALIPAWFTNSSDSAPSLNLLKLRRDGSVDPGFNPGVQLVSSGIASEGVAETPAGGFLIAGALRASGEVRVRRVARLNADGSLDPSFRDSVPETNEVSLLAMRIDGRFLLVLKTSLPLNNARLQGFLADGSPDPAFVADPGWQVTVTCLALDPSGRIVVAASGTDAAGRAVPPVLRLRADGSPDPSFVFRLADPAQSVGTANALAVQSDGGVVVALTSARPVFGATRVIRLRPDGMQDPDFGFVPAFESTSVRLTSVAADANDQILIAGPFVESTTRRMSVLRVNGTDERRLANPAYSAGAFGADLHTRPGRHYTIEAASDPVTGPWTGIGTVAGDGTRRAFSDPGLGGRFYRVRVGTE